MTRRLVVQPQSDLDIQAAAVWYEDQQSGLGTKFLNELDQVFLRIVDNPRQFPHVEDEVHRALLRHFPYGVYFHAGKGISTCWPFCVCIDILRCGKVEITEEPAGALPAHNARHRGASGQVFLKERV